MGKRISIRVSEEEYETLQKLIKNLEKENNRELSIREAIIKCARERNEQLKGLVWICEYVDKDIYNNTVKKLKKYRKKSTLNNILKGFIKFS